MYKNLLIVIGINLSSKGNSVEERELTTEKWLNKYELGLKEIECLGRKDILKKIIYNTF